MERLEKYITDERTGLKYELIGDYYFIAGDDEPEEERPIGIWGQRYLRYIKQHKKIFHINPLTGGTLNEYLADIDKQAEGMFFRLVNQMAARENITEKLKEENQMEWVGKMNNIRNTVTEFVNRDLYNQTASFYKNLHH